MVAELVEAPRVERSEKKFKILHVTKILNFIFLTHCYRTDKPMD